LLLFFPSKPHDHSIRRRISACHNPHETGLGCLLVRSPWLLGKRHMRFIECARRVISVIFGLQSCFAPRWMGSIAQTECCMYACSHETSIVGPCRNCISIKAVYIDFLVHTNQILPVRDRQLLNAHIYILHEMKIHIECWRHENVYPTPPQPQPQPRGVLPPRTVAWMFVDLLLFRMDQIHVLTYTIDHNKGTCNSV
jgi:hypothetical protein